MARTLKDAKLDTRASRLRLRTRREPYWRSISEGLAIGYRKGIKGGTFYALLKQAKQEGKIFKSKLTEALSAA